MNHNEKDLMALLESSPEEGMQQLLDRYTGLVWKMVSMHVSNPEDIKECVNDVFTEAYLHRAEFDPAKGSLSTWLGTIAKNQGISRYRKNQKKNQDVPLNDENRKTAAAASAFASGYDPDSAEEMLDLCAAIAALKPEESAIIRQKYYNGMTVKEIAESMNLPYETVKKRHQRSLKKLKYLLLIMIIVFSLTACTYGLLRILGVVDSLHDFLPFIPATEGLQEYNRDTGEDSGENAGRNGDGNDGGAFADSDGADSSASDETSGEGGGTDSSIDPSTFDDFQNSSETDSSALTNQNFLLYPGYGIVFGQTVDGTTGDGPNGTDGNGENGSAGGSGSGGRDNDGSGGNSANGGSGTGSDGNVVYPRVYTSTTSHTGESDTYLVSVDEVDYSNGTMRVLASTIVKDNELTTIDMPAEDTLQLALNGEEITDNITIEKRQIFVSTEDDETMMDMHRRQDEYIISGLSLEEEDVLPLTLTVYGVPVDVNLGETEEEPVSDYAYASTSAGSILALPEVTDSNLFISLYPMQGNNYTLYPSLIRGLGGKYYGGAEGQYLTLTAGSEDSGNSGDSGNSVDSGNSAESTDDTYHGYIYRYSPYSSATYYSWEFGEVPAGDYTLTIPHLILKGTYPESFEMGINLTGTSSETGLSSYDKQAGSVMDLGTGTAEILSVEELAIDDPAIADYASPYEPSYTQNRFWRIRLQVDMEMPSEDYVLVNPCIANDVEVDPMKYANLIEEAFQTMEDPFAYLEKCMPYWETIAENFDAATGIYEIVLTMDPEYCDLSTFRFIPGSEQSYDVMWDHSISMEVQVPEGE